jgi:hypothetical protein
VPGQPRAFLVAKEAVMRTWKTMLFATVLGALVMLGGAGSASAQNWNRGYRNDACYRKIQREERDLDRAIRRFGYYSRQANGERRELRRLQGACGYRDRDDRWRR